MRLHFSTSPALSVGSGSGAEDSSKLYRQDDCNYIDHRLKLHLMMNVFSQDEEDFSLILKVHCQIIALIGCGNNYFRVSYM